MGFLFQKSKRDEKAVGDDHYARGQWLPALEAYERVSKGDPENVKLMRRIADLQARVGRGTAAVQTYRKVADLYAESGFLVQAIAIQKILLRLDPSAEDVGRKLAALYARRGLGPRAQAGERRMLPAIPLFSELDPDAFGQLVERLVPRSLAMGELLFRKGDPGDSIFLVASGTVRVSREGISLAELGEGSFFGEGAFFSHEPRNADVIAITPAELLEIRREDAEALVARYPGVAQALAGFYRRRVLDGVLAGSPVFGLLPEEERRALADRFELVRVGVGETVVVEGDRDRSVFLVKRGTLSVAAQTPAGRGSVDLGRLGPGSLFGEVSLLADTPRTATVRALEEVELLRVAPEVLQPVLESRPEVRRALERLRDERAADAITKVLGRR